MQKVSDAYESIFDAAADLWLSDISVNFWKKVFEVSESA